MGLIRKQKLKPTDVLAAILAVDGKGSRLDADMVDGYHADEIIDGAMEQVSTITSYTAAENKIPMGKGTQGQIDPSWLQSYYTTSQVDNAINGAAMKLILKEEKGAANGVATLDANSKIPLNQIPALQSKYLSIEGGDMVGDIVMHDFTIVGLPTPTVDDEAATKGYVDKAVEGIQDFVKLDAENEAAGNTSFVNTSTGEGVDVAGGSVKVYDSSGDYTITKKDGVFIHNNLYDLEMLANQLSFDMSNFQSRINSGLLEMRNSSTNESATFGLSDGILLKKSDTRSISLKASDSITVNSALSAKGNLDVTSNAILTLKGTSAIDFWVGGKVAQFNTNQFNMLTHKIINVGAPTAATDAATKGYVDQAVAASGGNEWDDMGKAQLGETEGYICFKRKIIGNGGNADGNSTIIYEYMIHSDYHDIVICKNPAMETGIEFDYFKGVEYITPPGNETVFNRYNLSGCAGYNFPIFYKTPLITTFNRFSFTNCNLQLANNLKNTLALNYDLYWPAGTVVSADMDVVIPAGTILSRWLVEATND